jgi:hypothetical protein
VTSVSPIISAAAVEAVRPGWRMEFKRPVRRRRRCCDARGSRQARQRLDHVRGRQGHAHEACEDAEAKQQSDTQRAQPTGEDAGRDGSERGRTTATAIFSEWAAKREG